MEAPRNSAKERRDERRTMENIEKETSTRKNLERQDVVGVYIPPFKMRNLIAKVQDMDANPESNEDYQRLRWDALRKSINGLINKVNVSNIEHIIPEIFKENLIRGRGLFCRALMKAQLAYPEFTKVYAALLAVINTKIPEIGELLLKRVIRQFKRSFRRNDKISCLGCCKFIAHLVNQQVCHEIVALELSYLLLDKPTDDSVEICIDFIKQCGFMLKELIPQGLFAIFERFRGILQEGMIDTRIQYLIEGLFVVRRSDFSEFPAVDENLDLVEAEDQIPHELSLNEEYDPDFKLDLFSFDNEFKVHEEQYDELRKDILGDESDDLDKENSSSEEEKEDSQEQFDSVLTAVDDTTEADSSALRRKIYLTIMSSANFEECTHKLMKIDISGREKIMGEMLIECCVQERTFLKFYGLIGERLCRLSYTWRDVFDELFADNYATIHRLETAKIRNLAKFYAHLLHADALDWGVFEYILLTEEETTSSSRIFAKILLQDLAEICGIEMLKERFYNPEYARCFSGLFPKDSAKDCRFAINFFTTIGLGPLTDGMREYLKELQQKMIDEAKSYRAPGELSSDSEVDYSSEAS